jgi:hypothetical protein
MNIFSASKYGFTILAGAGILGGCSGSQSLPSGTPDSAMSEASPKSVHPDHQRSWISPLAKRRKLLYIADPGANSVDIFDLPSGKQVGALSGFDSPQGLCSDGSHVWVTNTDDSNIFEYDAGASTPVATLRDPQEYPLGCSYDGTTGNLAVANVIDNLYGPGNVAVYTEAKGLPKAYTCSGIAEYSYVGYDNQGNLYVDGEINLSAGGFGFCGLPKGNKSMENISLNQTIEYPGQVQWDGQYVTVSDQDTNMIYRFTIDGTSGTEEGSTSLTGPGDCVQNWIEKNKVYCPNGSLAAADIYPYPAGGAPIKTISGFTGPAAATVAKAKE